MEDGTTQGKMKRKGMINPKFNAINVINIYEYRSSTNNMEGQTNYVKKKKKSHVLLAYEGESDEKKI